MASSYALYQIAKKGYLQRTRSYRFIIIIAITIIFVYLFVPGPDAPYRTFSVGDYKGIYNSSYIAIMTAIGTSLLVSLFSFFTINNALELDKQNHMGEIIASTSIKNRSYLLGQVFSNFAILLTILATIISTSAIIFYFRQQESGFQLVQFFIPFILICIPLLLAISVLAVIFETFFLSKYITMAILYYLFYMLFLGISMTYLTTPSTDNGYLFTLIDPFGIIYVIRIIQNIVLSQFPSANVYELAIGFTYSTKGFDTIQQIFLFNGINWSLGYIVSRLIWSIIPVLFIIVASNYFKRFDPSYDKIPKSREKLDDQDLIKDLSQETARNSTLQDEFKLSTLKSQKRNIQFITVFENEIRMQFKGRPKWWIGLIIFFFLAGFGVTTNTFQLWSIAWICILPVISSLGSQEKLHDTYQIIFSSPNPTKQFYYQIIEFFSILACLNLGIIFSFIMHTEFEHVLALLIGILFTIVLAYFLGIFTGSKKLFESFFLLLFYLGPLNGIAYFDFIGTTSSSISLHMWILFLIVAILLLGVSTIKRKRVMN